MAQRRPLVFVSGTTSELPVGDTVTGAGVLVAGSGLDGGGILGGTTTVNVSLAPNASGLIFVGDTLGIDGSALASGNAALSSVNTLSNRTITAGSGLLGGGNLTADRRIDANYASQVQAEAGTDNLTLMTPLRTAQSIAALGGASGIAITTYSGSATFTKDARDYYYIIEVWGGGGAGASISMDTTTLTAGGGGGGAYNRLDIPASSVSGSVSVVVGAGGLGGYTGGSFGGSQLGAAGNQSYFGSYVTAFGGGGGGVNSVSLQGPVRAYGGGGGGTQSAGTSSVNSSTTLIPFGGNPDPGSYPRVPANFGTDFFLRAANSIYGGGLGALSSGHYGLGVSSASGGSSYYGGGGGGGPTNNIPTFDPGNSVYGGGGGAGINHTVAASWAIVTSRGGFSQYGGLGGSGFIGSGTLVSGYSGLVPAGGGGATVSGYGGNGGDGRVVITAFRR